MQFLSLLLNSATGTDYTEMSMTFMGDFWNMIVQLAEGFGNLKRPIGCLGD